MTSKISQVLRETDVQQVTGFLIKYDQDDELEGKCAMGVLACESGKDELKLGKKKRSVPWGKILSAYDITQINGYPHLNGLDVDWDFEEDMSLMSIIVTLNDTIRFSFDEIAEFLEVTFDL